MASLELNGGQRERERSVRIRSILDVRKENNKIPNKTYVVDGSLNYTEKVPSDDWPFDCGSEPDRNGASVPDRLAVASSSCSALMIWVGAEPADDATVADLVFAMRYSCSLLG